MLDEMETVVTSSEYLSLKINQSKNLEFNNLVYLDLSTARSGPKVFLNCRCNINFLCLAVSESQQVAETGLLITELLHSINQSGALIDYLRGSWTAWLLERTASSPVLMGVLRVIGMAVASSSTLGHLMEAALEAYFKYNSKQLINCSRVMGVSTPFYALNLTYL